ncbi:MAG: hypothetical protein LBP89_08420 [Helicobacteraceae bacterium]|jgi:TPR repeat protein|nr:hypothetical protein [Helicobacteraceae bacterium]
MDKLGFYYSLEFGDSVRITPFYDYFIYDPKEAVYWYEKAARAGYKKSQRWLEIIYSEGYLKGYPKDEAKAAYWRKMQAK